MLSVEEMAIMKVATGICNNLMLKKEILCAPGSEYDINRQFFRVHRIEDWHKILKRRASELLENLGVAKHLQEKVVGILLPMGMRMLIWAEYHEGSLGLTREFSVDFLNSSLFTPQGVIDNKKAAEALLMVGSLSLKQRYKLACLYCFTEQIPWLFREMTEEDKAVFYDAQNPANINQPQLVNFWSYTLMDDIQKIKGSKSLFQFTVETTVRSGSKAAVEYCYEETDIRRRRGALVYAAVDAVKNRIKTWDDDWVVFRDWRYNDNEELWTPSDYFMDILCFLLSKMREDQQIDFLMKDIDGADYRREPFETQRRSRVLGYFLNWPYQIHFMKTAEIMWEFLPRSNYAVLLLMICDKIGRQEISLKYGEGHSYDYRKLLKEFWFKSPEFYKSYVFMNDEVTYVDDGYLKIRTGVGFLYKLITINDFTYEDIQVIKWVLGFADDEAKEDIFYSLEWENICIELMKDQKWKRLDGFILNCFQSKEEQDRFRRKMSFTNGAQSICIEFVKDDKWNAAESLIKWTALPEDDIRQLKKKMAYTNFSKRVCKSLIFKNLTTAKFDRFCEWFLSSEEEIRKYKKEVFFTEIELDGCVSLMLKDHIQLVDKYTTWCLFPQDVKDFKNDFAYRVGYFICEKLISDPKEDVYADHMYHKLQSGFEFEGGNWELIAKFLTWCFSSEEEITDFKKKLLEISGVKIHFDLIKTNKWLLAETFFAWLGLSAEEIKELKKDTLFYYGPAGQMFYELMHSQEGDVDFAVYGSKEEAIELFLRWYLTEKDMILEFKEKFKQMCQDLSEENSDTTYEEIEDVLTLFDFMTEQRLRDLDKEKMALKRKSETFPSNEGFCE